MFLFESFIAICCLLLLTVRPDESSLHLLPARSCHHLLIPLGSQHLRSCRHSFIWRQRYIELTRPRPDTRFIVFHGDEHNAESVKLTGVIRLTTPESMSIKAVKLSLEGKRRIAYETSLLLEARACLVTLDQMVLHGWCLCGRSFR